MRRMLSIVEKDLGSKRIAAPAARTRSERRISFTTETVLGSYALGGRRERTVHPGTVAQEKGGPHFLEGKRTSQVPGPSPASASEAHALLCPQGL